MVETRTWHFLTFAALDAFMKGLAASGPTKSGHHTPAIITTLPTDGTDEHVMRANAWMVKQVLARGVHGILLCHAETPGAVKVFVESARYPFQTIGVGEGLDVGRRGAGGQGGAASIWGISTAGIHGARRCLAPEPRKVKSFSA